MEFLVKKALELEAVNAKIIPIYQVFVEKRVVLKGRMYRVREKTYLPAARPYC
ncbi:hypothetical protein [Methanosarcina lacustris]|uniref:hypothetical protein n=1 Tax=Methanosarcina lacustris TaxID=170861 RepID=UPI000B2B4090|nr:hypothetical protein [Methanosarcina lacustris]